MNSITLLEMLIAWPICQVEHWLNLIDMLLGCQRVARLQQDHLRLKTDAALGQVSFTASWKLVPSRSKWAPFIFQFVAPLLILVVNIQALSMESDVDYSTVSIVHSSTTNISLFLDDESKKVDISDYLSNIGHLLEGSCATFVFAPSISHA